MSFQPDYKNIEHAATNQPSRHIPLYEHIIAPSFMESVTEKKFAHLLNGSAEDKIEFFQHYNAFWYHMGYDTVSYEHCISRIFPGGGALRGHVKGAIQTREDFDAYPWDSLCERYFTAFSEEFKALRKTMPEGMRAVGGVGNGVFECVQDLVGLTDLCYMKIDDEALYRDMFQKVGDILVQVWEQFLQEFGDIYCVCRFGDDLGFKSATLLHEDDVRALIIPQYKRIIETIHKAGKPFLLHSCGCIFNVMDDIIAEAGIDAKHSNEDAIAPYRKWVQQYGDKIGNFGGLDTDALCDVNPCDIVQYTENVYRVCEEKGRGVAIGSGNSIPAYVSETKYRMAIETLRRLRGE